MGCGASRGSNLAFNPSEKIANRKISKFLDKQGSEEAEVCKLLFLGSGGSGKSTLFKQVLKIYEPKTAPADPKEEAKRYIPLIITSIVESVKVLIREQDRLSKFYTRRQEERESTFANVDDLYSANNQIIANDNGINKSLLWCRIEDESLQYVKQFTEHSGATKFTPELSESIKAIWKDKGIQNTWMCRNWFYITNSIAFFLNKIDDLSRLDYEPTFNDTILVRTRTTGIIQKTFSINGVKFLAVDVGGQRNERKKWIHCFEAVTAVLFVASLDEFDTNLFEDQKVNAMQESINLFREMCSSSWFERSAIILFLNKTDLFKEKLKHTSIDCYFKEYKESKEDVQAQMNFIKDKFIQQNELENRAIYFHFTCATDTKPLEKVFLAVSDAVLKNRLADCGLD